jgi:hypothetical protein
VAETSEERQTQQLQSIVREAAASSSNHVAPETQDNQEDHAIPAEDNTKEVRHQERSYHIGSESLELHNRRRQGHHRRPNSLYIKQQRD